MNGTTRCLVAWGVASSNIAPGKTLQIIPPHHGADFNDDDAIRAAIDRHIKQRR